MCVCPYVCFSVGLTNAHAHARAHRGATYIKTQRLSYIYATSAGAAIDPETWSLATWSNKTKRINIMAGGQSIDIDHLPPETHRNKRRKVLLVAAR